VVKKSFYKNLGFTLIELLVVISIIGFLATASLVAFNSARMKARDARRLAEIKSLQKALQLYYNENSSYPISSWLYSYSPNWLNNSNSLALALKPYIKTLPIDPLNQSITPYSGGYSYGYFASNYGTSGQWYMIVFRLEQLNHPYQQQDGVRACNGQYFHYGNGSNGIITIGGNCNE